MIDASLQSLARGLVPRPRRMAPRTGRLAIGREVRIDGAGLPARARAALERALASVQSRGTSTTTIEFRVDASQPGAEAYTLELVPDGARIVAAAPTGLAHGARTLAQLARAVGPDGILPCLAIEDAPALARRGVMLDVSRDRVPRMDALLALVERLASWKLNELQLYVEHTFAYAGHEAVWRDVDPFTPDEVRTLDRHCGEHGITLVPNQQSFGHLHHWLRLAPYRHLAEVPDGIVHPFLRAGERTPEPFSLCPTDPRSLAFLGELYDQLLPCFASDEFNVGLDETIDLGPGRSAAAIAERGVGRVYLDFLKAVHGLVQARGKRMQFWADIVLHHAELVPEVPRDAIACLWGYEADHPFERETALLADAGLDFVVCPGTSSWQSIGGRIDNMRANIAAAARHGRARGARGLLVTDWGDRGHLQPPCVSLPGFLVAADQAWNADGEVPDDGRLASWLDASGERGAALVDLGHAARPCGVATRNASPLSLLLTRFDDPFPLPELTGLSSESLEVVAAARDAGARTTEAPEIAWANAVLAFAARLGSARLAAGDGRAVSDLAGRQALAEELAGLCQGYRRLWPRVSRPGGLERSARWLERLLEALQAG
jgi:hexosaminidase